MALEQTLELAKRQTGAFGQARRVDGFLQVLFHQRKGIRQALMVDALAHGRRHALMVIWRSDAIVNELL